MLFWAIFLLHHMEQIFTHPSPAAGCGNEDACPLRSVYFCCPVWEQIKESRKHPHVLPVTRPPMAVTGQNANWLNQAFPSLPPCPALPSSLAKVSWPHQEETDTFWGRKKKAHFLLTIHTQQEVFLLILPGHLSSSSSAPDGAARGSSSLLFSR